MRLIRIGYVLAVLVLAVGAILWIGRGGEPDTVDLPEFSDFQLTRVSPSRGSVYLDREMTRPADLQRLNWSGDLEFFADPQTAFEFICFGALFTAQPGSSIRYRTSARRLELREGDFTWSLARSDERVEALVGDKGKSLLLPSRGRLLVSPDEMTIWVFSGRGSLKSDGETLPLFEHTRFSRFGNRRPRTDEISAPPEGLAPGRSVVTLRKPNDSVVRFSWKRVPGARGYVFRLYPSSLRERVLIERIIPGNKLNVELMVFREHSDFYWDVAAVSAETGLEGVPARAGNLRLEGSLLGEKSVTRPPQLVITSLTVGGNIVLIKGEAESNSQLFINAEPVKIDMDGKFIHTMTFRNIGVKNIEFRLVSPSETETVLTRQVTIFEEGI